jgi:hypothetical protein
MICMAVVLSNRKLQLQKLPYIPGRGVTEKEGSL